MKDRHECLADFPVVITLPIIWGDQDAFGHVNNTVYLRWAETARVEYLIRVGMWPPLPPKKLGPILASLKCDYRIPLTHPDRIHIGTRVSRVGKSSLQMDHRIVSHNADAVAAEIESTLVLLDYSLHKAVRVPDEVRRAMVQTEGRDIIGANDTP